MLDKPFKKLTHFDNITVSIDNKTLYLDEEGSKRSVKFILNTTKFVEFRFVNTSLIDGF